MRTFDETVNKLKWTGEDLDAIVVGYFDRREEKIFEVPLREFLVSEIPRHRARYLKQKGDLIWDRRPK